MNSKIKKTIKHNAFTLAEILITITLIGIVAALTIAGFMKNYQKQVTVAKLKSAYGTLSRIIQRAEMEHGSIASWHSEMDIVKNPTPEYTQSFLNDFANTYMIPYLQVANSGEKTLGEFGYKKGVLHPDGSVRFSNNDKVVGMQLTNGIFIYLNYGTHSPRDKSQGDYTRITSIRFEVDIDGPNHGANTFGKDVYTFLKRLTSDLLFAQIQPEGAQYSTYFDETKTFTTGFRTREDLYDNCAKGNKAAAACGALIMVDGWQIKDDYPWF